MNLKNIFNYLILAVEDQEWLVPIKITKQDLPIDMPFKLELIPLSSETNILETPDSSTQPELLDNLIASLTNTSDDKRQRLMRLWRNL
jgi:hypothetical protein